jgi:DNA mismatch endonuclease (patch repair protein)
LHRRDLPGTPDLVFPKLGTVLFVHGCFWHQHDGCRGAAIPTTGPEFWRRKLDRNSERDAKKAERLLSLGWRVVTIWE